MLRKVAIVYLKRPCSELILERTSCSDAGGERLSWRIVVVAYTRSIGYRAGEQWEDSFGTCQLQRTSLVDVSLLQASEISHRACRDRPDGAVAGVRFFVVGKHVQEQQSERSIVCEMFEKAQFLPTLHLMGSETSLIPFMVGYLERQPSGLRRSNPDADLREHLRTQM